MPEWLAALTVEQIIGSIAGLTVVLVTVRKVWKPIKSMGSFLNDWNGEPEVKDASGTVIKEKVPGVLAQIEVLRDQLQNSHQEAVIPNLRDDLDTKASKDDVSKVAELLATVAEKLDEHINISKNYDAAQEDTARRVEQIAARLEAPPPNTSL